jgi:hypothetical protein
MDRRCSLVAEPPWQHGEDQVSELFIGGEGLQAETSTVLVTMLHEAAHGIAHTRQIKDTSRQGRYHNDRYRNLDVYHDETRCRTGNNIESWNRVSGTGGLKRCTECADWQTGRRSY